MAKWRCIGWAGIILGIVISAIDFWVKSVPYAVTIPIEILAIVLIFAGFILRKSMKTREK